MSGRAQYAVPAAHILTVTAISGVVIGEQIEDSTVRAVLSTDGASHVFGPYLLDRIFIVHGDATAAVSESDASANIPSADEKALLDAIPATDQNDSSTIFNDAGVLKVSTAP